MNYIRIFMLVCFVFCMAVLNGNAQTWTSLNGPQIASGVKDISIDGSGNFLYMADAAYVLKSADGGNKWRATTVTYSAPLLVLCKPSNSNIVLAATSTELVYNAQGGSNGSWEQRINLSNPNLDPLRLSVATNDNTIMLLGRKNNSGYSIYRSSNSGDAWYAVTSFAQGTDIYDFASYPDVDNQRERIIWTCGSDPNGSANGTNKQTVSDIKGLWVSHDYGESWTSGPLGENNLRSIAIVPKAHPANYHLYAVSYMSSGNDEVFKSTNLGSSWTTIFNGTTDVRMVRYDEYSSYMYLATNDGVYRSTDAASTDGGGAWYQKISGMGTDINILSLAIDDESNIYAGTAKTVYRSTNQGDTWLNIGDMNASSVVANVDYAWSVTADNAYTGKYTKATPEWSNAYIQSAGANFSAEHIFRKSNGYLFVAGALSSNANLQRSINDGTSYSEVYAPTSSGGKFYGVTGDPTNSNILYAYGGATVGTWKNVFNSNDGGASWVANSYTLGSNAYVYDFKIVDGSKKFAALSNGNIHRTVDNGANFPNVWSVGSIANSIAIPPGQSSVVYAGGSSGLWKSNDGGVNWGTSIRSDNVKRIVVDLTYTGSTDRVFALSIDAQGDYKIFKTTNSGGNWSEITGNLSGKTILDLKNSPENGPIYAATSDGIYKFDEAPAVVSGFASTTENNHPKVTWNQSQEADWKKYEVWKHFVDCAWNLNKYVCGGYYGDVLVTGITQKSTTQFTDELVVIQSSQCTGVANIKKAYYYIKVIDNGLNQSSLTANSSSYLIDCWDDEQENKRNGGSGNFIAAKPDVYSLESNYPNPFNPTTQINYALPEDGHVTLIVFDILGREVATLVDGFESAGYKTIDFNANNLSGGVYYYRLQAGTFSEIRKMLLVK